MAAQLGQDPAGPGRRAAAAELGPAEFGRTEFGRTAVDPDAIERLAELASARPLAVLTGAGISTDSGIPDYRGKGAPARTPMRVDVFLGGVAARQRFWAGAFLGDGAFGEARPNQAHLALVDLERAGHLSGVVTQNVDGLHRLAGSVRVVELHGNGALIRCIAGGHRFPRAEVLGWVDQANPELSQIAESGLAAANPDADAEVAGLVDLERVVVPHCPICGGVLRPDVVFFGEYVPAQTFQAASEIVAEGGALLVIGSSLAVNSGIRLLNQAERAGAPIAIINRGPTKGDARAVVRLDCGAAEALSMLRDRLLSSETLQLEREIDSDTVV